MSEIRTLRPGLLVSLGTSIRGNVHYRTAEVEGAHKLEDGSLESEWNTRKTVIDPVENEAATKVRTEVRGLILKHTIAVGQSTLMCPLDKADALTEAIALARAKVAEFNATAAVTNISLTIFTGKVEQDDVRAMRDITEEVRNLMEDMIDGVASMDVKTIRDNANKLAQVGQMLSDDAQGRLEVAITAARKSARQLVKAGETAALEIDKRTIAQIDMARTSFLDFDMESVNGVAAPEMSGRALDLEV